MTSKVKQSEIVNAESLSQFNDKQYSTITFNVVIQQEDSRNGYVSIRGNIPELGNWGPSNIIFKQSETSPEHFFAEIDIPFKLNSRAAWSERFFEYKFVFFYFILFYFIFFNFFILFFFFISLSKDM